MVIRDCTLVVLELFPKTVFRLFRVVTYLYVLNVYRNKDVSITQFITFSFINNCRINRQG